MPTKAHRTTSAALLRARNTSGGSSKVGLNLHFTQKDAPPPKHPEKSKRHTHPHEAHHRNVSPHNRSSTSSTHSHSRDQLQPPTQKRAPLPHSRLNGTKPKTDFTIASPTEDEEDEWVSSGSGAATPMRDQQDANDDEEGNTPVEQTLVDKFPAKFQHKATEDIKIPQDPIPRVDTLRPAHESDTQPRTCTPPALSRLPTVPRIQTEEPTPSPRAHQRYDLEPMESRSEFHFPTQSRPASKRFSLTRPPSAHSMLRPDSPLRPHPLIRGLSHGKGSVPGQISPLAPLSITSDSVPAQIASSPPYSPQLLSNDHRSVSPLSTNTSKTSPTSSQISAENPRRTSFSSSRSGATLPSLRDQPLPRTAADRHRTLSNISSSSSFSALASLAHLPAASSRPPTPQMVAFFPPVNSHVHLEPIHPLLPPPYTMTHATVLQYRAPIRESFDRVMRAKQSR